MEGGPKEYRVFLSGVIFGVLQINCLVGSYLYSVEKCRRGSTVITFANHF